MVCQFIDPFLSRFISQCSIEELKDFQCLLRFHLRKRRYRYPFGAATRNDRSSLEVVLTQAERCSWPGSGCTMGDLF